MMIAPTPTSGDSGYSRLTVMRLTKHLPRRPIDDLPRFPVPPENCPRRQGSPQVCRAALAGWTIECDFDHRRPKISVNRDLGDVVIHPNWSVGFEELCYLIAKSSKPRHLLRIERLEKAPRIVGFHALTQ